MQDTPRILVVDDEPGVRTALLEILHPQYQVMTAESGATALHVSAPHRPTWCCST
jgi:CheY-like chemotaxis protein